MTQPAGFSAADAFVPLAGELAELQFSEAADTVSFALAERLRAEVQRELAKAGLAPALFLLLDQLEELVASDRTAATRRLLAVLHALADCPERNVWVVIAIADQWRPTLGSAGLLAALEGAGRFALSPPRLDELREIVEVPARRAGLAFEQRQDGTELDQVILNDLQALSLHTEAPLPLLQVALAQLEDRKDGDLLTFAAYREMGGVAGAIGSHARAALAEWQTAERQPVLDRLLFRLLQRDSQQRIVCRLAPRSEIEADVEMRALEEHLASPEWRLLQGHNEWAAEGAIRIAHDVLLDHAEAFRAFVQAERDNILLLADARDAAARWATEGKPAALLNHHLPSVDRLQLLLTRLGVSAHDELVAFVTKSHEEIGRLQCERDAALKTQSRFLAELARQQNESADFASALAIGLHAIPDSSQPLGRVIASEAVVELDRAARSLRLPRVLRGHEDKVWSAAFNLIDARMVGKVLEGRNARIVTTSGDKTARIWSAKTGEAIAVLRGHRASVISASFDRSGRRVLTASHDGTARLWDADTGAELAVMRGHEDSVLSAVFDPRGERIATASSDATARLWDGETGEELLVLRGHSPCTFVSSGIGYDKVSIGLHGVVFDSEGSRVLTAGEDHTARLWDAATGVELVLLKGHEMGVTSAKFDEDGMRVLTTSYDHTARLWAAKSGEQLAVFRCDEREVTHAVFDFSGMRVLTASRDLSASTVRLWDDTGALIVLLRCGDEHVLSVMFHQSAPRALTETKDHALRVRDVMTGASLAVLRGHEDTIQSVVIDQSAELVVTTSHDKTVALWDFPACTELAVLHHVQRAQLDPPFTRVLTNSGDIPFNHTVGLWDIETGKAVVGLPHEAAVQSAVLDSSGERVLTASVDQTTRLWDVKIGRELIVLHISGDPEWRPVSNSSKAHLNLSGDRVLTISNRLTAELWDADTGDKIAVLGRSDVSSLFDVTGTRVLTASGDTAKLWDARTGAEVAELRDRKLRVSKALFDPTGARVLTIYATSKAAIWDSATGAKVATFRHHDGSINNACFNGQGTRVLTASGDTTARVWDANTGVEIAVMRGHQKRVDHAWFDPKEIRVLTTSLDDTVRLWNAATGAEIAILRGYANSHGRHSPFDPSGMRILTTSLDHTVHLWDSSTGIEVALLVGHEGFIESALFDETGARVLTASEDRTARVWDTKSGAPLAVLRGHEDAVWSALFDKSGVRVLTVSRDKTARIWRVFPTVRALVEHARAIMPRELTPAQRKQFFLD